MRILVVEDEKEIADGISKILENAGYQMDVVYDGLAGLDYIFTNVYDLILMDVMMPKVNGFDVVKSIRAEGIETPVIMLTAKSQIEDKIQGLNIGADDYITKPFDGGELLARISARVRGKGKIIDGRMAGYDVCINPANYKLEKDSKSIKLSKTEYQLMEYFIINKGQIISKDMIINRIWGSDDDTDYNNIEVYVSFLRKKLKFVEASSTIITKKGIGYSFACEEE